MNEQLRPASLPVTTQAAEGLVRRRFTVAEIESMVAGGIIAEDERVELIGGEVVPMSPKGARHEIIRNELAFHFARQCPAALRVASETPLTLAADEFVEPDILVHPKNIRLPDLRGDTVLLVVEVADSSLAYDLNTKASIYAAHGVREYWVINAKTLETRVHRGPAASGYADVSELPADQRLTPQAAPELAVSLDDLDLD
jgi:Uma2 family endonuclease